MIVISGNSYTEKDVSKTSDNIFIKNDNLLKENKKLKEKIKKINMEKELKINEIKRLCNNELRELYNKNLYMLSETIKLIEKIKEVDTNTDKFKPVFSEERATILSLKIAARNLIISLKDS